MAQEKKSENWLSVAGIVLMALILPGLLKTANGIVRYLAGAEGRLAAITIETGRELGPLPKVWSGLAQGGDNLAGFLDLVGDEVKTVQPKYIRIDHIYDGFEVVNRQQDGLKFNWERLDSLVDKIASTGATPFFSLSYMPAVISSGNEVSEPKNWNDWSIVVQKTIEHYSGEKNLKNVYYEVWNEPDLFGKWKIGGKKDYRNLYQFAARGAGSAQGTNSFKFGGPATTGLYRTWTDNFMKFVAENNLRLDFISWHRYDLKLDSYISDVQNANRWIENNPIFSKAEKIVTESGPNSEIGNQNDTMTGAAHLVATARELMFNVNYVFNFGVSGKWGMVGKPRFEALKYLAELGDSRLAVTGEGSWVKAIAARDKDRYQVVLVNYDPEEKHNEAVPVSFMNLTDKKFLLTTEILGGIKTSINIATDEAILQTMVPMAPNSVARLELFPEQP